MKVALLFLGAFLAPALAKNFGGINVDGVGTVYVVGPDWAGSFVQVSSNELKLNGGGRIYFAKTPSDSFSPDIYWKVNFNRLNPNLSDESINLNFVPVSRSIL